jgi:hypothetical protein
METLYRNHYECYCGYKWTQLDKKKGEWDYCPQCGRGPMQPNHTSITDIEPYKKKEI